MIRNSVPLFCLAALTGCNSGESQTHPQELIERVEPHPSADAPQNSFGFAEAMETGPDLFGRDAPRARLAVASTALAQTDVAAVQAPLPSSEEQIAYSYGFGFQIDGDSIAPLQQRHVAICESLKSSCKIMRISRASSDSWDGYGELELRVASSNAVTFGNSLAAPAQELGGELISSVRDGEDLTEQIIDSEARLNSRLLLRDKLTSILRGNRGSVSELIKAEEAVADVNEEIDSTRNTLKQLQNRVRYSAVRIEYEPYFGESQTGFVRPVMTALKSIQSTLGISVAILIYLVVALIPVALLVLAIRWLLHRFGKRIRFWRKDLPAPTRTGTTPES